MFSLGPWRTNGQDAEVYGVDGGLVAEASSAENARLVALAPEMYALLRELAAGQYDEVTRMPSGHIDKVRIAHQVKRDAARLVSRADGESG
jgi:hypothetical protein